MPAKLLTSRYVPKETLLVRKSGIPPDKKYKVEVVSDEFYLLTRKDAVLEMVFREDEMDYVFDMMREASQYYEKSTISEQDAKDFAIKVATGEIKYSVSNELGLVKVR